MAIDSARKNRGRWGSLSFALAEKRHVMAAVMLRDMRTRFFNHGLGFLMVSLWPFVHVVAIIGIHTAAGRAAPYGDNAIVYYASGLVPTLAFMYVSRFMALSLALNKPMLSFPVVHVMDVILARAALEIIAAFITLALMLAILYFAGMDPFPYDPVQAILAYLTALLLAVGVGCIVSVITLLFQFFLTVYFLTVILIYATSGSVFEISSLPDAIAVPLSYSPVLQCVEWMRLAYYPTYNDRLLDRPYTVACAVTALFIGLLLERLVRGKLRDR